MHGVLTCHLLVCIVREEKALQVFTKPGVVLVWALAALYTVLKGHLDHKAPQPEIPQTHLYSRNAAGNTARDLRRDKFRIWERLGVGCI